MEEEQKTDIKRKVVIQDSIYDDEPDYLEGRAGCGHIILVWLVTFLIVVGYYFYNKN